MNWVLNYDAYENSDLPLLDIVSFFPIGYSTLVKRFILISLAFFSPETKTLVSWNDYTL